jgi:2-oxoglutarate dehydrogenase E2 component (dihydrolipoamide succinyltransferase)
VASDTAPDPKQAADTDQLDVSGPAVRKLLHENNLDANQVTGTGKGGRLLKEDVLNYLKNPAPVNVAPTAAPAVAAPAPAHVDKETAAPAASGGHRTSRRVPMTRLRSTIAKRLVSAQNEAAMLTTYNEVDMSPIMALRTQYKAQFEKAHNGTRLGFMSFFVKAAAEALKRYPAVNASLDGNDMVYHAYQDVSVAVSTDRGLVVPVLRDVEAMTLADIEKGIVQLATQAKDGKLTLEDMQGGTFTITNGGIFGSLLSTPILNQPQTAILGMHKIQDRPVAENGQVVIRPMMYLALSYDHRMIDGKEAVQFLVTIKELLQDPARILLEI